MKQRSRSTASHNAILPHMIREIEAFCKEHGIDHRFVGGVSYGGLLNEKTSYAINIKNRTIKLKNYTPLHLMRPDESVRDIDIILLTQDPAKIWILRKFLNALKWKTRTQLSFTPPISFEGIFPLKGRQTGILEYVTTIRSDGDDLYLAFDKIRQKIPRLSLEPWTVILNSQLSFTTRNPIADYYAYQFRSPAGVKPKDITKLIHLKKLVDSILEYGKKDGIDYMSDEYFRTWQEYVDELQRSTIPSVQSKRLITRLYWNTIGTTFAHGKGIIGKAVFSLFNLFNRLRQ